MNPNLREAPHLILKLVRRLLDNKNKTYWVFMSLASVTSPLLAKCSRNFSSDNSLGKFLTIKRDLKTTLIYTNFEHFTLILTYMIDDWSRFMKKKLWFLDISWNYSFFFRLRWSQKRSRIHVNAMNWTSLYSSTDWQYRSSQINSDIEGKM